MSLPQLLRVALIAITLATAAFAEEETDPPMPGEGRDSRVYRFGLACVYNDFAFPLNYQVKWGEGEWQSVTVNARSWRSHWWRYDPPGSQKSPELRVKFDSDLSGGFSWITYKLTKYASEDTDCSTKGKKYRYVRDNSATYIDLRSFN